MVISILKRIKDYLKELIKLFYIYPGYVKLLAEYKRCNCKKIILIGTPAHGNLGDHAIAVSELEFIERHKKDKEVFEIPTPLYKTCRKFLKKHIKKGDTVIISGGGWMGNLWMHNEVMIRSIIEDYPDNRIIIFPQTLYYTDDTAGNKTAGKTRRCFEKHKELYLAVRDDNSLLAAKSLLGFAENTGKLLFCPDMALYGSLAVRTEKNECNKKVLLCLRSDIEKNADISAVADMLKHYGYDTQSISTVQSSLIKRKDRRGKLDSLLLSFSKAEFVVTDRLHAMIFSLLAGVPCYVFNNVTGKVFGVASYLRKSGLPVRMLGQINEINKDTFNLNGRLYELSSELNAYFSALGALLNS